MQKASVPLNLCFSFARPHSVPPLDLMGLCGLARLLLLGSVLNMKETETHTQTSTHRLVLLAALTFSGKASLFQFHNEEMGTFDAVPPIHQRGYWNTYLHARTDLVSIFFYSPIFRQKGHFYIGTNFMMMGTAKIAQHCSSHGFVFVLCGLQLYRLSQAWQFNMSMKDPSMPRTITLM